MSEVDRVRWHCRRGMLELDLMLHRFIDQHLARLSPEEMECFTQLLELQDNALWQVLSGRAEVDDPRLASIVSMIRNCC